MYIREKAVLNICHQAQTWTMNTSCSHGRFLEKTSFMLIISRCPCKTSRENKKERQKAFPVHTCFTLATSPVPKTLKDEYPSTQHRQQTDRRQTDAVIHQSDIFQCIMIRQQFENSYCTWWRGFSLGSERQKEKYHRGGLLCCCHEKNKEHF